MDGSCSFRFALLQTVAIAIRLAHKLNDPSFVREAVKKGCGEGGILGCVIMPFSLIVLLVEAILGAVSHLLLSNIPSRACLWLAGIP
jgi:hypothetical protein